MKAMLEKLLDEKHKKTGKTYRELSTLGLINGAVKGNAQNYKTMLEVLGEVSPIVVNTLETSQLLKVDELLGKIEKESKK